MPKDKQHSSLVAIGVMLVALAAATVVGAGINLTADPLSNVMPISWDQAYSRIIVSPNQAELDKGEILLDLKQPGDNTVMAQSIGLIEATPEECFRAVRDYNHYTGTMPYTIESMIVRAFKLEGENPGAEAVDFWTRISVLGIQTRYLIRVVHLTDPEDHLYRSFWTLVHHPAAVSGCNDSNGHPCENGLDMNIGSHRLEPFKGNPDRTLHTYTLKIKGKSWAQYVGLRVGGGSSMRDLTKAIREAVAKNRRFAQ